MGRFRCTDGAHFSGVKRRHVNVGRGRAACRLVTGTVRPAAPTLRGAVGARLPDCPDLSVL